MEKAPQLNGLVETALFVEDLERACDFYEQVLGLQKIRSNDRGCVFRVSEQRYLLLFSRAGAGKSNETPYGVVPACALPQHKGRGPAHVAFGISNEAMQSWRERLAKDGVDLLSDISWETGARSLYFRDPDGHLIELATPGIWESA